MLFDKINPPTAYDVLTRNYDFGQCAENALFQPKDYIYNDLIRFSELYVATHRHIVKRNRDNKFPINYHEVQVTKIE